MPFDFPSTGLVIGQTATAPTGAVYVWDGVAWRPVAVQLPPYAPLTSPVFSGNPQAPTMPVGDADQSIASTAFVQQAVAPTYDNVGRNLVMNPLFNIAQRGAGPWSTAGAYTVDRWALALSGDTNTISQVLQNDAGRAQIGDEASTFTLQSVFTGSAAAGSYSAIRQSMEGVRRLAGKTVTVSFWAWSSPTALKVGINLIQNFGTGGSPSAAAWSQATGSSVTLTPNIVRYSVTISIPSVAGKTLGTNGDDFTGLWLWYSSGATNNAFAGNIGVQSGTVWLWGIQLEYGSVVTPLDYGGTPADQLRQCQRFFQNPGTLVWNSQSGGSFHGWSWLLPVQMRAAPVITWTDNASNASRIWCNTNIGVVNNISFASGSWATGPTAISLDANMTMSGTQGAFTTATWSRANVTLSADL